MLGQILSTRRPIIACNGRDLTYADESFGVITLQDVSIEDVGFYYHLGRSSEFLDPFDCGPCDWIVELPRCELSFKARSHAAVFQDGVTPDLIRRLKCADALTILELLNIVNQKVKAQ